MSTDEIKIHEILFDGSSLQMGKIHWYILRASNEMYERQYVEKGETRVSTAFAKEVAQDETHWWVFKKETDIDEFQKKTHNLLEQVQKLKEDSLSIKNKFVPESYDELVYNLKEFASQHSVEINALYDYVVWLFNRDVLAPSILFSYRVWGSTRRSVRIIRVIGNSPEQDENNVKTCIEIIFGLRDRMCWSIYTIYNDMASDIADSYDPEDRPSSISVDKRALLTRTSYHVLGEFAAYFEFIRQSLRNIMLEVDQYMTEARLLYDESFWIRFTLKAMADGRVETQLWDFKNTLEMWHCASEKKIAAEIEFAEDVAGFANANGGLLIIGISDKLPRKIIGITNIEEKINSINPILSRYVQNNMPLHLQQIRLKDENGKDCDCLIIVVAQTKNVIEVKNQQGWSSYPLRVGAAKTKGKLEWIRQSKAGIFHHNYNFVPASLVTFVGAA